MDSHTLKFLISELSPTQEPIPSVMSESDSNESDRLFPMELETTIWSEKIPRTDYRLGSVNTTSMIGSLRHSIVHQLYPEYRQINDWEARETLVHSESSLNQLNLNQLNFNLLVIHPTGYRMFPSSREQQYSRYMMIYRNYHDYYQPIIYRQIGDPQIYQRGECPLIDYLLEAKSSNKLKIQLKVKPIQSQLTRKTLEQLRELCGEHQIPVTKLGKTNREIHRTKQELIDELIKK